MTRTEGTSGNRDQLGVPLEADYIYLCHDRDHAVQEETGESYPVRDHVRVPEEVEPQRDRARLANPARPRGNSNQRARDPEYLLLLLTDPGLEARQALPLEIFEYKRKSARLVCLRNLSRIVI